MGQTIIKGIGEDGIFKTEHKSTPVLITELIGDLHKLCEAEICDRLKNIRESSEPDERIRKTYAAILRMHYAAILRMHYAAILRKHKPEKAKQEDADE